MSHSIRKSATALITLVLVLTGLTGKAPAQVTFEIIGEFALTGLSADGAAGTGLTTDGLSETVRWTPADGVVRLGQSSGAILGKGAGSPRISADGLRISSTIASLDSTVMTQGRWTKGLGWEETMPPIPPGGADVDGAIGSAWGISGDGETVVGLYWLTTSRAHASSWTSSGGIVDLDPADPTRSSRANAANYDGSVIVGWSTTVEIPMWQPTVWENGVKTVLYPDPANNRATAVNPEGTIVGGSTYDPLTEKNPATLWIKNGNDWQMNTLGVLPGTNVSGRSAPYSISSDASIIVGYNQYAPGNLTGFVWTPEQGLMKADDYLESIGVVLPTVFRIDSMTAVTPDGRVLGGHGIEGDPWNGGRAVSFLVTRWPNPTAAPPLARSTGVRIEAVSPNPFNPSTSIPVITDHEVDVDVRIYNVAGRLVSTLFSGRLAAGRRELEWNGRDDSGRTVPSGVYFARAYGAWGATEARRMTLIK